MRQIKATVQGDRWSFFRVTGGHAYFNYHAGRPAAQAKQMAEERVIHPLDHPDYDLLLPL